MGFHSGYNEKSQKKPSVVTGPLKLINKSIWLNKKSDPLSHTYLTSLFRPPLPNPCVLQEYANSLSLKIELGAFMRAKKGVSNFLTGGLKTTCIQITQQNLYSTNGELFLGKLFNGSKGPHLEYGLHFYLITTSLASKVMATMNKTTWTSLRYLGLFFVGSVVLLGCTNRRSNQSTFGSTANTIQTGINQGGFSSGGRRLAPLDVFEEFTGRAKVFSPSESMGNYLFSTGSGNFGFGAFNLDSGDFHPGRQVLTGSNGVPGKNFLGSDPGSITAMTQVGRFLVVSGSQGLTQVDVGNKANPFVFRHLPERVQVNSPLYKYQWNAMVAINNGRLS